MLIALSLPGLEACDSYAQPRMEVSRRAPRPGVWISNEEIQKLPTDGAAWLALTEHARLPATHPDLSNQDDPSNVCVLAKALYYARTRDETFASEVRAAFERVQGSERYADTLSIGRELIAYVIAADIVGLSGTERTRFEN